MCVYRTWPDKRGVGGAFLTPTETNGHGDALCFMVKAWARHKTTETVLNNGGRLAVAGGWYLAVGGGWRVAVGGWRLAVGGPPGGSLRAGPNKKRETALGASDLQHENVDDLVAVDGQLQPLVGGEGGRDQEVLVPLHEVCAALARQDAGDNDVDVVLEALIALEDLEPPGLDLPLPEPDLLNERVLRQPAVPVQQHHGPHEGGGQNGRALIALVQRAVRQREVQRLALLLRRAGDALGQGCMRRKEASGVAPAAVRQAVGGGCQSGWGRLLSVTNAIGAGTCCQGVTRRRLGALEVGRGGHPPSNASLLWGDRGTVCGGRSGGQRW